MHWLGLIVAIVFLNSCFFLTIHSAKSNDPCSKLKCNKTEVVCIEKTNNGSSFECRCAKSCTTKSLNQTQPRGVRYSNSNNKTVGTFNKAKIEKLIPIAKQGGSACYPSACMNGGTCFTNANPNYYYQASQKSASARSNTTPPTNYNPPLCACMAQFTGARCQNFKTAYAMNGYYNNYQTTTNSYYTSSNVNYLTTSAYSNNNNNNYYNAQPAQPAPSYVYTNNNNNQYYSSGSSSNYNNNGQTGQFCNVYNVNNQNICQNGGQCVFVSASQVACICPSTFMGQYCEIPVYNTCPVYSSGGSSGGYGSSGSGYGSSGSSYGSSGSSYGSSGSNYPAPAPAPANNYAPSYGSSGSSYGSSGSSYGSSGSNYAVPAPAPANNYAPSYGSPSNSYGINAGTYRSGGKSGKLSKAAENSHQEDESSSSDDLEESQETMETMAEKRTTTIDSQDLFAKIFSTKGNDKVDKYGYMSSGGCNPSCTNNQPTLAPLPSGGSGSYNSYNNNNNQPSYGGSGSYGNTLPTLAPLPSVPTLAPLPSTLPTLAPLPGGSYYNSNNNNNYNTNNNNNNNYNSGSSGSSQFAQQQCHRVNGNCQPDGSCLCNSGYTGPRCDQPISGSSSGGGSYNYNYYSASVNNNNYGSIVTTSGYNNIITTTGSTPTNCITNYCLNGGTCQTSTSDPYVVCICPTTYTGQRCEISVPGYGGYGSGGYGSGGYGSGSGGGYGGSGGYGSATNLPTLVPVPTTPRQFTLTPRCNFTIKLQNDGFYTARLQVQYTLDGIVQPLFTSGNLPFIGQQAQVTLPYYATDIVVIGQRLGFTWANTFTDTGINTATRCTKCYKVWGAVTDPHWDYLLC